MLCTCDCSDVNIDDDMPTTRVLEEFAEPPNEEDIPVIHERIGVSDRPAYVVGLCPNVVVPIVGEPEDGGSSMGSMGVQAETAHITEEDKVIYPM